MNELGGERKERHNGVSYTVEHGRCGQNEPAATQRGWRWRLYQRVFFSRPFKVLNQ